MVDKNGKWLGKYRIPSARYRVWDYGANALYFVTICTGHRNHYFGEVLPLAATADEDTEPDMAYTEIGALAETNWLRIPEFHDYVTLDEFVVMPNHIHAILAIEKPVIGQWKPNKFGPQHKNLGVIMKGYKSSITSHANHHNLPFSWQTRFHDHIIRTDEELYRIRNYINCNRANWPKDRDNKEGLYM